VSFRHADKEVRAFAKKLEALGLTIEHHSPGSAAGAPGARRTRRHPGVYLGTRRVATLPSTPKGGRWKAATLRQLRRAGIDVTTLRED